jgi:hypothetical protein
VNVAEELDKLAKLHAQGALTSEEFATAKSQVLSARPYSGLPYRSVRRQSSSTLMGLPLWAVALGPDVERGEIRGHARGIFAFGDMATGWFAFGGLARGIVAIGGLALGVFAFGGAAVGGIAFGGAAIGVVAIGGGAAGYYAMGGAAAGTHAVSALHQDPEAVEFFRQYLPWLPKVLHR